MIDAKVLRKEIKDIESLYEKDFNLEKREKNRINKRMLLLKKRAALFGNKTRTIVRGKAIGVIQKKPKDLPQGVQRNAGLGRDGGSSEKIPLAIEVRISTGQIEIAN